MKDKILPPDYDQFSVEELTEKANKILKKTLENKKKALKEIEKEKYKKKDVSTKEASDFLKKYAKRKKWT